MEGIKMIRGIGVDMTEIREVRRLAETSDRSFVERTFTEKEREASLKAADRWEYLAARFAVKEAVFKALAHLTRERTFDFREIETLNKEDGSPYITLTPVLQSVMEETGASKLHVSVTHEKEYACAFVIAESDQCSY